MIRKYLVGSCYDFPVIYCTTAKEWNKTNQIWMCPKTSELYSYFLFIELVEYQTCEWQELILTLSRQTPKFKQQPRCVRLIASSLCFTAHWLVWLLISLKWSHHFFDIHLYVRISRATLRVTEMSVTVRVSVMLSALSHYPKTTLFSPCDWCSFRIFPLTLTFHTETACEHKQLHQVQRKLMQLISTSQNPNLQQICHWFKFPMV